MRILRLDSLGGASGDMLLGVVLGLGADRATVEQGLQSLLPGHFQLHFEQRKVDAVTGVSATVELPGEDPHHHQHDHAHEHGHEHLHSHDHDKAPQHHDHHHWSEIRTLIEHSSLPKEVQILSCRVFALLAQAEGKVHGKAPEEVAFHEVGAVDSIVDIVGSCYGFYLLGIDGISLSPLPTGSGTVRCAHGIIPVPAPATAELLRTSGLNAYPGDEPFELLTPTGAALLAAWPKREIPTDAAIKGTVNSFGKRLLNHTPNLLRGLLYETAAAPAGNAADAVEEFACNLDDTAGEELSILMEELFAAGALDVWYEHLTMKKSRPGVKLGILAKSSDHEKILDTVFQNSTTLGIRYYPVQRACLERKIETIQTQYGAIPVKFGYRNGVLCSVKPEFDACRNAALQAHTLWCTVAEAARTAALER